MVEILEAKLGLESDHREQGEIEGQPKMCRECLCRCECMCVCVN